MLLKRVYSCKTTLVNIDVIFGPAAAVAAAASAAAFSSAANIVSGKRLRSFFKRCKTSTYRLIGS